MDYSVYVFNAYYLPEITLGSGDIKNKTYSLSNIQSNISSEKYGYELRIIMQWVLEYKGISNDGIHNPIHITHIPWLNFWYCHYFRERDNLFLLHKIDFLKPHHKSNYNKAYR